MVKAMTTSAMAPTTTRTARTTTAHVVTKACFGREEVSQLVEWWRHRGRSPPITSVTEVLLGAPDGGAVFTTSNFRGILGTRISRMNTNNGKNESL